MIYLYKVSARVSASVFSFSLLPVRVFLRAGEGGGGGGGGHAVLKPLIASE